MRYFISNNGVKYRAIPDGGTLYRLERLVSGVWKRGAGLISAGDLAIALDSKVIVELKLVA